MYDWKATEHKKYLKVWVARMADAGIKGAEA